MAKEKSQQSSSKGDQDTNGSKNGEDLTTLLEPQQREDVTLLIANCTESMRKTLTNNFDATAGLNKTFLQEGLTDDEKMMAADVKGDVSQFDSERKLKEASEKDLSTLKMKNLKKNSLKTYDDWRQQVLMRVGEVVNSKETASTQLSKETNPKTTSPTPKAPSTIGKITDVPSRKLKFRDLFPPAQTPLTKLPMPKRTIILHSVFLLLLSLEHYNAFSRVLMLNLTSSLKLPLKTFEQDEYTTAKGLLEAAKEMTADSERQKREEEGKEGRKWRVNVATAAGAAVVGLAGSMAAPLVAAGVGSVMGGLGLGATAAAGYLGSVAGSTVLVGGLFGAYGGRMTGQMMDQYAREVEDFEFLPVHSGNKTSEDLDEGVKEASEHDHKLRVTICVSGWLTEKEEVVKPWAVLGRGAEVFALKYELEALLNLGHAMDGMLTSAAWGYAQRELVKRTIFAELAGAMWPIGLMKVARVLDNPFSVAKGRAEKAGEVLADALVNRAQGERPVTLIGYSLGARVIYSCLHSLAKRKAFGLVESVVMIGAPTPSDTSDWRVMRSVVSGRLINVFSTNDYLLGFMYRSSSLQYGVAGLEAIKGLSGIENVDVSEDVDGHTRYRYLIGSILKKIGFEDVDMEAVEEEKKAMEKMLKEEKKQSLESQRKRLVRRKSTQGKEGSDEEAEHEANEMEKGVQDATQKDMMTRVIEWWYAPTAANKEDAEKVGKTLSQAVQDPRQVGDAAWGAYGDLKTGGQTYAEYVAAMLPSMPGKSSGGAGGAVDQAGKTVGGVADGAQSYAQQAKGYIPDGSSLPSMPSWGGKKEVKEEKEDAGAADKAKKTVQTGAKGVQSGYNAGKNVLQPTVQNLTNLQDNPAVKAGKDTMKNTPIIHQASDRIPGANKAAEVTSDTVGTTVQNTTGIVGNTLTSVGGKAEDGISGAATKSGLLPEEEKKGYMATAAGYMPSWSSGAQKSAPKKASKAKTDTKDKSEDAKKTGDDAAKKSQGYLSSATGYLPSMSSSKPDAGKDADKATKNAKSKVDDTTKKAGKAADDAKKTGEAATKQGQGYLSSAAGYLPSMSSSKPDAGKDADKATKNAKSKADETTKKASKAVDDVKKTGADATKQGQGYLSSAAGYLPSMSSSKPSAGKQTDTKKQAEKATESAKSKAGDVGKQANETADSAKKAADGATKQSQGYLSSAAGYLPSMSKSKPTAQKKDDTTKQAEKATGAAKSKAEDTKKTASKVTDDTKSKSQDTTKTASKTANDATSKAQDTAKTAAETPQKAGEQASGYLGGLFSSSKKKPAKLDRTASGVKSPAQTPSKPDLKKVQSSNPTPQLEETASGVQSPKSPPKLSRQASGIKSPSSAGTKSLIGSAVGQKSPSGARSPPPKLGRKGSSFQQPQTNLDAVASSLKSSAGTAAGAPKAAASVAQKGVTDPQAAAADTGSKVKETAGQGQKAVGNGVKAGQKQVGNAAEQGQKAAKQGQDAAASAAASGQKAVGGGVKQGQKAAKQGQDAVGSAAANGQKAVGGGVKEGQKQVGNAAEQGKNVASKGGSYLSGAGGYAWKSLGGGK